VQGQVVVENPSTTSLEIPDGAVFSGAGDLSSPSGRT
jgi:hypothetical protein